VEAGAHVLDVNAGIPLIEEPAVLAEAIQTENSRRSRRPRTTT